MHSRAYTARGWLIEISNRPMSCWTSTITYFLVILAFSQLQLCTARSRALTRRRMIILPPSKHPDHQQHPQFNYQSPALPLAQAPSEEPQCQPPALFTPHQSLDRLTTLLPSIRHQPAPTPPLHLVTVPREASTTLKRPMSSLSVPSSSKSSLSSSREPPEASPPIDPVRTKPRAEEAGSQTPRST